MCIVRLYIIKFGRILENECHGIDLNNCVIHFVDVHNAISLSSINENLFDKKIEVISDRKCSDFRIKNVLTKFVSFLKPETPLKLELRVTHLRSHWQCDCVLWLAVIRLNNYRKCLSINTYTHNWEQFTVHVFAIPVICTAQLYIHCTHRLRVSVLWTKNFDGLTSLCGAMVLEMALCHGISNQCKHTHTSKPELRTQERMVATESGLPTKWMIKEKTFRACIQKIVVYVR